MIKEILEHRSIRAYKKDEVKKEVLDRVLTAATRASTTGNMQLYSIIVTTDATIKKSLAACHFNQPMIQQAPMLVTFCADINRFSHWCTLRGAEPCFDNFAWFINASIDAVLASQNFSLAAESEGLGICYLGTTIYTTEKIVEVLSLPKGVIPIATLVVGYPDATPALTDRLPVEAVVHYDQYHDYSDRQVDHLWREKESLAETLELLKINNLENLAKIFTQNRYKAEDSLAISKSYFEALKKQGFFTNI